MKNYENGMFLITEEQIQEIIKSTIAETNQHSPKDLSNQDDDLLTIKEVTELFQISKVTLHSWKRKGLIPSYRMGRRVYFKKNEVMEALSAKKGGGDGN